MSSPQPKPRAQDRFKASAKAGSDLANSRIQAHKEGVRSAPLAWALWGFLGLLAAHRFYLLSFAAGARRLIVNFSCIALAAVTFKIALEARVIDGLQTFLDVFHAVAGGTNLGEAAGDAAAKTAKLLATVGGAILLLLAIPIVLWLLDARKVRRELQRRAKVHEHRTAPPQPAVREQRNTGPIDPLPWYDSDWH